MKIISESTGVVILSAVNFFRVPYALSLAPFINLHSSISNPARMFKSNDKLLARIHVTVHEDNLRLHSSI
jgi:hypothetical protein